jgi:hypothetical protein
MAHPYTYIHTNAWSRIKINWARGELTRHSGNERKAVTWWRYKAWKLRVSEGELEKFVGSPSPAWRPGRCQICFYCLVTL